MQNEHFDIVIVGAGLSGIGAACHLQTECPDKRYTILESRAAMGGTWDLFRYPGIRSDSDMHTLGYDFRPWRESEAIADGPAILSYIRDTAREYGVDRHIRYDHSVRRADWSGETATWTIAAERGDGSTVSIRCNMLLMCSGYYSYEQGYLPQFPGRDRFRGPVVHPQDWPEDLDYAGKRVVVIGSGATAVTLVPAMADDVAHITMLQRSPTYVVSMPARDIVANILRAVLPDRMAYALTRWKNIRMQHFLYRQTRLRPAAMKNKLIKWVRKELGPEYDVGKHFTPAYNPWDQRLCLVPNSDLFEAIRSGKASVVTDSIDTFTESGIRLASGEELDADIIITATGLQLVVLGDIDFVVDGQPVDFAKTYAYKGIMCSGVPNMISTFGYLNASWTLRADLVAEFSCRLIRHMDEIRADSVVPTLRPQDAGMPEQPWVTGFSSGYIQRVMADLPKQGGREPWLNPQNYLGDRARFRKAPLDDGALVFGRAAKIRSEAAA